MTEYPQVGETVLVDVMNDTEIGEVIDRRGEGAEAMLKVRTENLCRWFDMLDVSHPTQEDVEH